jgi:hypothetical protein
MLSGQVESESEKKNGSDPHHCGMVSVILCDHRRWALLRRSEAVLFEAHRKLAQRYFKSAIN